MLLKRYNLSLLVIPVLIFSLGLITLYSVSPVQARGQLIYFFIGIFVYLIFVLSNYSYILKFWRFFYIGNLVLLIALLIWGNVVAGATRWLGVGGVNFQPSEFAKFSLIISMVGYISEKRSDMKNIKDLLILFLLFISFFIPVALQPDLGTALVLVVIFVSIIYFGGINKFIFLGGISVLGILSGPIWNLLKEYQKQRILIFLNPRSDYLGSGYNVVQSIIAVGSGGFLGRGFGRGSQSHLEFLPAYWTDFIFASYAEEWGFAGVVVLLLLFFGLFISIWHVAYQNRSFSGNLLSLSVLITIFTQFIVNVGMNLGIMPVTGIPLPLMTYGGSSLITSLALLGLVQSAWVHKSQ